MKTYLFSGGFIFFATIALFGFLKKPNKTAPPTGFALVELFTSEGCSSCPPADEAVAALDRQYKGKVYILGYHVDYWNYLGWKDAWSDADFSGRQRAFAQLWHSENVYTPEFVLAGREWHNWFTGKNGPKAGGAKAGVLTLTSTDTNHWQVCFAPENPPAGHYQVHAALLAGGIISDVLAGENQGRRLTHDFVAINFLAIGLKVEENIVRGKFLLDAPRSAAGNTLALTAWVTRAGELEPLQATGGWLIPPPPN